MASKVRWMARSGGTTSVSGPLAAAQFCTHAHSCAVTISCTNSHA
jgi:hypothetical protein